MSSNRYLAAIMFTDIVGYTDMMGSDEDKAMETLRRNRSMHKKLAGRFNGTWLKEIGDGTLLRFPSASDAVLCAGALLKQADQLEITLRIGIHMGEVVEEGGDVFGDGVNIASRIESQAEYDTIFVSESIARNVQNKTGITTSYVGSRTLKNVSNDVRIYRVDVSGERIEGSYYDEERSSSRIRGGKVALITGLAAILLTAFLAIYLLSVKPDADPITNRSIAVLPFDTFGQSSASNTSFTNGIQSGLLTRLSNISGLSVTSRTSTLQYRDNPKPVKEIASELNIKWIVRGEVQETESMVQVNARLIEATEDRQVWAKDYRRELTANNLFDIQSSLAREISQELQTRLSPKEEDRVGRIPTSNLQAYRQYARGLGLLEQRTPGALLESVDYFWKAIALDSTYAPAWAVLGETLTYIEFYNYNAMDSYPVSPEYAVERALELNPELAEAHASRGILYYTRKDGYRAVEELRRAIELQPSLETAHNWLGFVYLLLGRPEEALRHAGRAIELNPLAPASRLYPSLAFLATGQPGRALQEVRRAREIQPDWGEVYAYEGVMLYHNRMYREALASLQKADSLIGGESKSIWIPNIPSMQTVTKAALGMVNTEQMPVTRTAPHGVRFWQGLELASAGRHSDAIASFREIESFSMWPNLSIRYFYPDLLQTLRQNETYPGLIDSIDEQWK